MINKNNLKYLIKIRNRIRSFKNKRNIEIHKSKMKSILDGYLKRELLFFEIKIYLGITKLEINSNSNSIINKIINKKLDECSKKIIEEIKLMEFIYVNGEIKNKNNLYIRLIIGIKSIIGYSKLLLKRYKYIFRNNKNINIKYLSNNKKTKNTIYKTLKVKDLAKQNFKYKDQIAIYGIYDEGNIIPTRSIENYNNFSREIFLPTLYQFTEKNLKLDSQFNSQYITSSKKISAYSLINIWRTYCFINGIYYSNNKLYKEFIFYEENDKKNKIETIEIKINNKLIIINNNEELPNTESKITKYIYLGELDYLVKNINFIMKFISKCYSQQTSKVLMKRIKKRYLKKAFRLLKNMPNLYLMEYDPLE